jgi:hypothetical protein
MVTIKFPDRETQDEAIGFLVTQIHDFKGRLFRSGELIVPEEALAALANENFSFTVIGKATYDQLAALRGDVARKVQ